MEKVITCPVCLDTDHCFEDVQEQHSSYLCFKCGYTPIPSLDIIPTFLFCNVNACANTNDVEVFPFVPVIPIKVVRLDKSFNSVIYKSMIT